MDSSLSSSDKPSHTSVVVQQSFPERCIRVVGEYHKILYRGDHLSIVDHASGSQRARYRGADHALGHKCLATVCYCVLPTWAPLTSSTSALQSCTCSQPWATNHVLPTLCNQLPTMCYQLPIIHYQLGFNLMQLCASNMLQCPSC